MSDLEGGLLDEPEERDSPGAIAAAIVQALIGSDDIQSRINDVAHMLTPLLEDDELGRAVTALVGEAATGWVLGAAGLTDSVVMRRSVATGETCYAVEPSTPIHWIFYSGRRTGYCEHVPGHTYS